MNAEFNPASGESLTGVPPMGAGPSAWRNWQAAEHGAPATGRSESALYSDAELTGQVDNGLGPYRLLNTVSTWEPRVGTRRLALILRVEHHLPHESMLDEQIRQYNEGVKPGEDFSVKTRAEAYYAGWIDDELASLTSLALGVRLRSGGITRYWNDKDPLGTPAEFQHRPPYLPQPEFELSPRLPELIGPIALDTAVGLLGRYASLPGSVAVTLVRAARLYASAIWIAEDDARMAWLQLVGALEAAAADWVSSDEASPLDKLQASWPELAALLGGCSDDVAADVAERLVDLTRAGWKLRQFLRAYPPPEPTARPEPYDQVDWRRLGNAITTIYGHRSADLHGGTPIPGPLCAPPRVSRQEGSARVYAERGFSGGVGIGDTVWSADDLPMHLHVFAWIVRGTLLKWWQAELDEEFARPPAGPRR
jgi:hypothetical protein